MTHQQITPTQAGITAVPDAEGIVVSTPITGGGWSLNHAEGIVVFTR
jgi:hypothetical protein